MIKMEKILKINQIEFCLLDRDGLGIDLRNIVLGLDYFGGRVSLNVF